MSCALTSYPRPSADARSLIGGRVCSACRQSHAMTIARSAAPCADRACRAARARASRGDRRAASNRKFESRSPRLADRRASPCKPRVTVRHARIHGLSWLEAATLRPHGYGNENAQRIEPVRPARGRSSSVAPQVDRGGHRCRGHGGRLPDQAGDDATAVQRRRGGAGQGPTGRSVADRQRGARRGRARTGGARSSRRPASPGSRPSA